MKLTIYRKIMIGFSVVMLIMVVANVYVLRQLSAVKKTTEVTLTANVRAIDFAKQLQAVLFEEERYARKYFISLDPAYFLLLRDQGNRFEPYIDSMLTFEPYAAERALLRQVLDRHRSYMLRIQNARDTVKTPSASIIQINEWVQADSLEEMQNDLSQYVRMNQMSINNAVNNVGAAMTRSSNVAYFLSIGALIGALGVAFFIARTISKPIAALIAGTEHIAHGSFDSIPVTSRDEIGLLTRAVNDMSGRLKQINDLKTELMHHISHELRAPLQAMRSANDFLAEQRFGSLNNQQLRLLGFIRDGINRISRFSSQFLDIAKIESGRMDYHFTRADLPAIVAHEVDEAKLTAYRKNIVLTFRSEPVLPIKADIEKVGQITSNLLTNAIKYTGEGGVIDVAVVSSDFGAKLTVKDSGVGISDDELSKIFTKFYQARNVNKASTKGTGVGLALVKAFAEGHGGKVSVESTIGVGTTFTVDFPAAHDEPAGASVLDPLQMVEAQT